MILIKISFFFNSKFFSNFKVYFTGTKLGFTDTDLYFNQIPWRGNIYEKLRTLDPNGDWMDYSNFPKDHPNYNAKNHLIPGIHKVFFLLLSSKYIYICVLKNSNFREIQG